MDQGVRVTFAADGCTTSFVLFGKYTTDQNQQGKDYAFKDFILDSVHKTTDLTWRED
jgi:hypothetical protein